MHGLYSESISLGTHAFQVVSRAVFDVQPDRAEITEELAAIVKKLYLQDNLLPNLLDEMFPPDTARLLREQSDHDAVHVSEVGRRGADDDAATSLARAEDRALVTENVALRTHNWTGLAHA